MLTTQELWDMPVGTPVYLVMFRWEEKDHQGWTSASKSIVPLRKMEFIRKGRLRHGMVRHARFIFDHEIGVHWTEDGWCDRDSVCMAVFHDEAHLNEWEQQKKEKFATECNSLQTAVDFQFKQLFGEATI